MSLFHYPKSRHKRGQTPRQFKRYQTYKRYLQREFARLCVYCRTPDTLSREAFGVDHYRPKSLFQAMTCDYTNLYYCCGPCNARKTDDWPADAKKGPYVVNPCDHVMADHLRFDASTARINSRTEHGQHMEELLQLNDDEQVSYRRMQVHILGLLEEDLMKLEANRKTMEKRAKAGLIASNVYAAAVAELDADVAAANVYIQRQTGTLALPSLATPRMGVTL